MGDDLYPAVEQMVEKYSEQTGDVNINAMHFTPQNPDMDGLAADYHPSPVTQKKAAGEMIKELKKWL